MSVELDHIFVCTSTGGTEASHLADFGLVEGAPNTHPGQGTACRRLFFDNAYLELLWVCNPSESQSELTRPTRIWDRWTSRDSEVCPFGFAFRPGDSETRAPFASWEYSPAYLPPPLRLQIATNANVLT